MDAYFEFFLQNFGPGIDRREVPRAAMDHYKGKLPDQLLDYWQEHGWCGYANGLFWTVDPEEYEPALDAWLGNTRCVEEDALHIVARSAFGHLLFWGERSGYAVNVFAPGSYLVEQGRRFAGGDLNLAVRSFFTAQDKTVYDFEGLFTQAVHQLGRLGTDEMYGFVPALALGGPAKVSHLQKVKAVEHLVMLAQLGELKVVG